jgi:hypothetical protein
METLERRRVLSAVLDSVTGQPMVTAPSFEELPAGYFRPWGVGSVSADAPGKTGSVLDVGDAPFTGTLYTLWGKVPEFDRAYVGLSAYGETTAKNWQSVEIVDVPGPTFEVRSVNLDVPAGMSSSQIVFLNDFGSDYEFAGPSWARGASPMTPTQPQIVLFPEHWESFQTIAGISFYDREYSETSIYDVSIDWHDGSTPQSLGVYQWRRDGQLVVIRDFRRLDSNSVDSIGFTHDLRKSNDGTLTIRRLTGTPSSLDIPLHCDLASISPDPLPPPPRRPTSTPQTSPKIGGVIGQVSLTAPWFRPVDEPVSDLGTFEVPIPLPEGTIADVYWLPREKLTVTPTPVGTTTNDLGETLYQYRIVIPPRVIDFESTRWGRSIDINLQNGDESARCFGYFFGVHPGLDLTRIIGNADRARVWVQEGYAGTYYAGSFTDTESGSDDAYDVTLTLGDGRSFPGTVTSTAFGSEYVANVQLPALWSSTGRPAEFTDDPDKQQMPSATLTVSRPGASQSIRVQVIPHDSGWVMAIPIDPYDIGLPPLFDAIGLQDRYVFADRRGSIDFNLSMSHPGTRDLFQVEIDWDRSRTSPATVTRNADGTWHVHAEHRYTSVGLRAMQIRVRYGDVSQTYRANAVVGDRVGDGGLLVVSNPLLRGAAADVDWFRLNEWFDSVQFYDLANPQLDHRQYTANVAFADGSPSQAMTSNVRKGSPMRAVNVSGQFATPGERAFMITLNVSDGRVYTVSCQAKIPPRALFSDGRDGGYSDGRYYEWLPPLSSDAVPDVSVPTDHTPTPDDATADAFDVVDVGEYPAGDATDDWYFEDADESAYALASPEDKLWDAADDWEWADWEWADWEWVD